MRSATRSGSAGAPAALAPARSASGASGSSAMRMLFRYTICAPLSVSK
jgi:hypothetical protein